MTGPSRKEHKSEIRNKKRKRSRTRLIIGLVHGHGSLLLALCDYVPLVPSSSTPVGFLDRELDPYSRPSPSARVSNNNRKTFEEAAAHISRTPARFSMMRNQYFLASLFLTSRILWRLSLLAATADHFLSKRRLDILFARARRVGAISYVGIDFSTE